MAEGQISDKALIYVIRLSMKAERYEDMAVYIKQLVKNGKQLDKEERNLLSVAYKNLIEKRRYA